MVVKRSGRDIKTDSSFNFQNIFAHILNSLTTLVAAYFLLSGTKGGNDAAMLDSAFRQINEQNTVITDLRSQLIRTQIQVIELEAKVRINYDEAQMLQNYLNVLPFPAWIKGYDPKAGFTMLMINGAYTAHFGITAAQYIGKTDFDVHPEELAKRYHANDLTVISTGRETRADEYIYLQSERVDLDVFKFPVTMPDGTLGVGGVAITHDEQRH